MDCHTTKPFISMYCGMHGCNCVVVRSTGQSDQQDSKASMECREYKRHIGAPGKKEDKEEKVAEAAVGGVDREHQGRRKTKQKGGKVAAAAVGEWS